MKSAGHNTQAMSLTVSQCRNQCFESHVSIQNQKQHGTILCVTPWSRKFMQRFSSIGFCFCVWTRVSLSYRSFHIERGLLAWGHKWQTLEGNQRTWFRLIVYASKIHMLCGSFTQQDNDQWQWGTQKTWNKWILIYTWANTRKQISRPRTLFFLHVFLLAPVTQQSISCSVHDRSLWSSRRTAVFYNFFAAIFLRAEMVYAYNASLNAKRNAAVMTLCVTFGPIPTLH